MVKEVKMKIEKVVKIKEKIRNRRNFKARHNLKTVIDTTEQKKIKLDCIKYNDYGAVDENDANAAVLPSKKRRTKLVRDSGPIKILNKKQRKKLEKIVATKEKKASRAGLIKELEAMHATTKNNPLPLISLQAVQTMGRRKYKKLDNFVENQIQAIEGARQKGMNTMSSGSVSMKRKMVQVSEKGAKKRRPLRDPTIVYLDPETSDTSSDDDICEIKEQDSDDDSEDDSEDEDETDSDDSSNDRVRKPKIPKSRVRALLSRNEEDAVVVPHIEAKDRVTAKFVILSRTPEFEQSRQQLPILSEEQRVMEAINSNLFVVIVGPTGSGKTTQVPQFLYEAAYANNGQIIGVTEPRRVAARSVSERVAKEMNLSRDIVSYQMRFESNVTRDTKIKFMTDGVLLKEFQADHMFSKYSAIIIDEAHERSIFSDILIGALSRVVAARFKKDKTRPLKLIVMSATLRVQDFTQNECLYKTLQGPPPVVKIDGRTFDVTPHYNKYTPDDYVEAAFVKVCKIHRELPEGGILVFLTGQNEIDTLIRKLNATFPSNVDKAGTSTVSAYKAHKDKLRDRRKEHKKSKKTPTEQEQEVDEESESVNTTKKLLESNITEFANVFKETESEAIDFNDYATYDEVRKDDSDDDFELDDEENQPPSAGGGMEPTSKASSSSEQPLYVLPLFSQLEASEQMKVFLPTPPGTRLCVIATNVAETSLTIPDVMYVVDSGKTKEKVFDKVTGVTMFQITNISQASADQRAGRAGRVAPGHFYRLYSSSVFNEFAKFDKPEILCRPIDDVVLSLKNLGCPVVNFPYPTPPDRLQITQGIKNLSNLGALVDKSKDPLWVAAKQNKLANFKADVEDTFRITALGRLMTAFPVAPRYAKMLCLSDNHNLWPYTIALVAALTVQEILVEMPLDRAGETLDQSRSEWRKTRLDWSGTGERKQLGDLMVLLRAVIEAQNSGNSYAFCQANGLRRKGLMNVKKLRLFLAKEVKKILPTAKVGVSSDNRSLEPLKIPSSTQCCALRQVVLSGSVTRVAKRVDVKHLKDVDEKIKWKHAYRTAELEEPVYLPSTSVLKVTKPEWVCYQDIFETHKMFMRGVTVIEPEWLSHFGESLCNFGDPRTNPGPYYDEKKDGIMCYCDGTYMRADWTLPLSLVPYPANDELYGRFAFHLLQGQVFKTLEPLKRLLKPTSTLLSPMGFRYRVQKERLIRILKIHGVSSKARLLQVWGLNSKYLLTEYLEWLEDQVHAPLIRKMWPPIDREMNEWLA